MTFGSILFPDGTVEDAEKPAPQPSCFADLNLNQIVRTIVAGKEEYDLVPFFRTPLHGEAAVLFRQGVMRDMEKSDVARAIKNFAQRMRAVREKISQTEKRYNRHQKMRWHVDSILLYDKAINQFANDLAAADLASSGLRSFQNYLSIYAASPTFLALIDAARQLVERLSAIRYEIRLDGSLVEVMPYSGAVDYGAQVTKLFERFDAGTTKSHTFDFGDSSDVNQIEGNILRLVAQTHPDAFATLERYCAANATFLDTTIARFDREVQFYICYLNYIEPLKKAGLPFCYPGVSNEDKSVCARETFDLSLANKLSGKQEIPVCNDFHLQGAERIIVVTGPNQGGKTTFARTFGQIHFLAALGCPVPGSQAKIFLPDQIFTHFERAEHMTSFRGKLQDDLLRIHEIVDKATPQSVILINEIFASTTLQDAIVLSRNIAERVVGLNALCVWVTFIDEIASLSDKTVSMVSAVSAEHPEQRTFKIVRQAADGLAYALSIARKYGLTHDQLIARIKS